MKIEKFVEEHENMYVFDSLGQLLYLSTLRQAKAVVGNSSSGLVEAPYLQTPTVNCGDRQLGRECPSSVMHTQVEKKEIIKAIERALEYKGPYDKIFGIGDSSEKIIEMIKGIKDLEIRKEFHDL